MSSSPTQKITKDGAPIFTVTCVVSSLISFRLLWLTVGRVLTNTKYKPLPSLPDTHRTVSGCTSKCPWTSFWTLKCSRRLLHGCGRVPERRKKTWGTLDTHTAAAEQVGSLHGSRAITVWVCVSVCQWANVFWAVGGLQGCEINIIPFTNLSRNYLAAVCWRKQRREHLENCIDYQLT